MFVAHASIVGRIAAADKHPPAKSCGLNTMSVTAMRYIDDILMVGADPASIDAAKAHAEKTLTDFGFGLDTPADGPGKAAQGECRKAINFLGCTIQPKRCVPSAKSIDNMKESVRETLAS